MADQIGGDAGREGLFAALKHSVATLVAIVRTRGELLVTELEEEKYRLLGLWSRAVGAALMLGIGVVLAVFCVAFAFWEQRVFVFGLFAALFVGIGLWLVAALKRSAAQPSRLFHASLAELDEDIAQLRRRPSSE